jgi:outer membrane protein assembly factor BamB/tetratricopeptide (TPR) repeat protein
MHALHAVELPDHLARARDFEDAVVRAVRDQGIAVREALRIERLDEGLRRRVLPDDAAVATDLDHALAVGVADQRDAVLEPVGVHRAADVVERPDDVAFAIEFDDAVRELRDEEVSVVEVLDVPGARDLDRIDLATLGVELDDAVATVVGDEREPEQRAAAARPETQLRDVPKRQRRDADRGHGERDRDGVEPDQMPDQTIPRDRRHAGRGAGVVDVRSDRGRPAHQDSGHDGERNIDLHARLRAHAQHGAARARDQRPLDRGEAVAPINTVERARATDEPISFGVEQQAVDRGARHGDLAERGQFDADRTVVDPEQAPTDDAAVERADPAGGRLVGRGRRRGGGRHRETGDRRQGEAGGARSVLESRDENDVPREAEDAALDRRLLAFRGSLDRLDDEVDTAVAARRTELARDPNRSSDERIAELGPSRQQERPTFRVGRERANRFEGECFDRSSIRDPFEHGLGGRRRPEFAERPDADADQLLVAGRRRPGEGRLRDRALRPRPADDAQSTDGSRDHRVVGARSGARERDGQVRAGLEVGAEVDQPEQQPPVTLHPSARAGFDLRQHACRADSLLEGRARLSRFADAIDRPRSDLAQVALRVLADEPTVVREAVDQGVDLEQVLAVLAPDDRDGRVAERSTDGEQRADLGESRGRVRRLEPLRRRGQLFDRPRHVVRGVRSLTPALRPHLGDAEQDREEERVRQACSRAGRRGGPGRSGGHVAERSWSVGVRYPRAQAPWLGRPPENARASLAASTIRRVALRGPPRNRPRARARTVPRHPRILAPTRRRPAAASRLLVAAAVCALLGATGLQAQSTEFEDDMPPRLLHDAEIDRLLRKADEFLARQDWEGAIDMLQRVLAGTLDAVDSAVFSRDGRLYEPVRTLCRERLAALPDDALALYRARHEVEAERGLATAWTDGDAAALEAVFERFPMTDAGRRALRAAADLHLDRGRAHSALRAYRTLLDAGHPDDAWLLLRIATCEALLRRADDARATLTELARHVDDEGLRIDGRPTTPAEVGSSDLFRELDRAVDREDRAEPRAARVDFVVDALTPLWEFHFGDPEPYRANPGREAVRVRNVFLRSELAEAPVIPPLAFGPGGVPAFSDGALLFLEHERLRIHDALTGRAIAADDGSVRVPDPEPGLARARVPVYDQATMRPVRHRGRVHLVRGPAREDAKGMQPLLDNRIVTLDARTLQPLWSTSKRPEYEDRTFLSAPTPVGDRLFVATADTGHFELLTIAAEDGALLSRLPLHAAGTPFARPPAMPPVHDPVSGTVIVSTNAGVVAAVDASTNALLWLRRYERTDPFRPDAELTQVPDDHATRRQARAMQLYLQELDLAGFVPATPVVGEGLVVLAPSDGRAIVALAVDSGEPVWIVEMDGLQRMIGADQNLLYVRSRRGVLALDRRTGVRLWHIPLLADSSWSGRGTVVPEAGGVLVPTADRLEYLAGTREPPTPTPIELPRLGYFGEQRLRGPVNVTVHGPWVVLTHAAGIRVFSTDAALYELAAEATPGRRAAILAQAGDLTAAIDALGDALKAIPPGSDPDASGVFELEQRLVALARELATAMATHGSRADALGLLDRCRSMLLTERYLPRWHLARIDVFRNLGDGDAVRAERRRLAEDFAADSPEGGR